MTKEENNKTLTELLREAILEVGSFRRIETITKAKVKRQTLMRFVRDEQSLRLDKVELLMEVFGIKCHKQEE